MKHKEPNEVMEEQLSLFALPPTPRIAETCPMQIYRELVEITAPPKEFNSDD